MLNIKLPRIKSILYVGLLLMIIKTILFHSIIFQYPLEVDSILQYVALLCFIISILNQGYRIKTLLIYAAITFVSVYSCVLTKEWGMLITVVTVLAIRKENINDVIYFIFKYELLFVILHILLALSMSLFGLSLTSTYNGETVFTLGFVHRNALSAILFNLIIMWLWISFNYINLRHIMLLSVLEIVIFIFVKTKTSTIISILIFIMILIFKNMKRSSKLLKTITALIVPALTVGLYYLTFTFGSTLSLFFDSLLTGRLRLNAYLLDKYGLTFFGQEITNYFANWNEVWQLSGKVTFDCLYMYLIVSRGIIWVIIISILFYLLAKKGINNVNLFIIAWALYGITEIGGTNCYICFPILLVTLLFDEKIKEIKGKILT